jgi:hypothetical protein
MPLVKESGLTTALHAPALDKERRKGPWKSLGGSKSPGASDEITLHHFRVGKDLDDEMNDSYRRKTIAFITNATIDCPRKSTREAISPICSVR